jgi:hypothetical protein
VLLELQELLIPEAVEAVAEEFQDQVLQLQILEVVTVVQE